VLVAGQYSAGPKKSASPPSSAASGDLEGAGLLREIDLLSSGRRFALLDDSTRTLISYPDVLLRTSPSGR